MGGHSAAVLLKVYAHAHAVDGQVKIARRRIEEVLADDAGEDHE